MINEVPKAPGPMADPAAALPRQPAIGIVQPKPTPAEPQPTDTSGPSSQPPLRVAASAAEELAEGLEQLVQQTKRQLQFKVDEGTGDTVIQVIDKTTDKVIREIPSEELQALRQHLAEVRDGATGNEQASVEGVLFNSWV